MNLDWYQAKPITFEQLRSSYSYGDLGFSGLSIIGVIDGVLHLNQFRIADGRTADLFVLFKDIRSISLIGEVRDNSVMQYEVANDESQIGIKRLTMHFMGGEL